MDRGGPHKDFKLLEIIGRDRFPSEIFALNFQRN